MSITGNMNCVQPGYTVKEGTQQTLKDVAKQSLEEVAAIQAAVDSMGIPPNKDKKMPVIRPAKPTETMIQAETNRLAELNKIKNPADVLKPGQRIHFAPMKCIDKTP